MSPGLSNSKLVLSVCISSGSPPLERFRPSSRLQNRHGVRKAAYNGLSACHNFMVAFNEGFKKNYGNFTGEIEVRMTMSSCCTFPIAIS